MLARTFARIDKLAWDMGARTVELAVTSFREQDIALIARYGIEEITASAGVLSAPLNQETANCNLHLPQGKPVTVHLNLGQHQPIDWVAQTTTRS